MNGFANKYLTPGRSQMWSSHKIDNSILRRYKRAMTHNYIASIRLTVDNARFIPFFTDAPCIPFDAVNPLDEGELAVALAAESTAVEGASFSFDLGFDFAGALAVGCQPPFVKCYEMK